MNFDDPNNFRGDNKASNAGYLRGPLAEEEPATRYSIQSNSFFDFIQRHIKQHPIKVVYCDLARMYNNNEFATLSYATIAARTGLARETVRRSLRKLEKWQLIETDPGNYYTCNRYKLVHLSDPAVCIEIIGKITGDCTKIRVTPNLFKWLVEVYPDYDPVIVKDGIQWKPR